MAQLVVRNIDENLKQKLRACAAQRGHSMEAEARDLLRRGVEQPIPAPAGLGTAIASHFVGLDFEPLEALPGQAPRAAAFDEW
jgi:plasmid stability protein